MSAKFGPAGNAESFPYKSSVDAPRWLSGLGLDAYEYQCGKGYTSGWCHSGSKERLCG